MNRFWYSFLTIVSGESTVSELGGGEWMDWLIATEHGRYGNHRQVDQLILQINLMMTKGFAKAAKIG
jgi:hypothetical protein